MPQLTKSNEQVSELVWRAKYAAVGEQGLADTWRRVARAVASVEADPRHWEQRFFSVLDRFSFLPGGRILAGAGVSGAPTLCNCFVLDRIEDTDAGVMAALNASIQTLVAGGGIGVDFSMLSPGGTSRMTGPSAAGPVTFMQLWQAAADAFLANALRRGAMMATLRCDHPDIEAFVAAKRSPGVLPRFNLSVQITDRFIAAIASDGDWPLVFGGRELRTIRARSLWEAIARAAYDSGEPGFLLVDQIQRENNLWWRECITACNPCGEAPLPPNGACDLGSLNLTRFVADAYTANARLEVDALTAATEVAVRFLDNVLDLTTFPIAKQADEARATRRIGLGITGLADMLVMLGHVYGDSRSLDAAATTMRSIRDRAYATSIKLAREKGAFPAFEARRYLESGFARRLPAQLRAEIARNGMRNSHLLAIAPTGSISLLAGGISTGIEPIFAPVQVRILHDADGKAQRVEILDPALDLWRDQSPGRAGPPPGFISARDLSLSAHIEMQAAVQPFVDQAISKTWNIAPDCSFEEFEQALRGACGRGLKGFTAFRSGIRESPLKAEARLRCGLDTEQCD